MKNFLTFLLLVLIVSVNYTQTDPCSIVYKNSSGIPRTRLIGIHENLLLVSDTGSYKIVNTDKIARIKFDNGKYWKTGAAFGAGLGFVGGFLVYQFWGKKKIKFLPKDATLGVLGIFTVPCAIIGGLIGMNFRNIDTYELSKLNAFVKAKEIKFIIRDHAQYK
ncbi:MAG: hypothetical protein UZ05_CHB002002347 [Chlorobi bacterium OLB5]|nr:MAG: hypothetical protein UZ05_CHB002002347 [Chlorobi bacterium OLB5]